MSFTACFFIITTTLTDITKLNSDILQSSHHIDPLQTKPHNITSVMVGL